MHGSIKTMECSKQVCQACCTSVEKVSVRFGGHLILDNVSIHLHCGELTALIGPNGAGKTTLIRAILGEVPYTGRIEFRAFGDKSSRPARIGYVPQKLSVDPSSPVTVLDLFASGIQKLPLWLGHSRRLRETAGAALNAVDAPDLLKARLAHLSGGELQRVLLAFALTPMPHILLLDEPAAGLDQAGLSRFYETIGNLRRTYHLSILLVSHDVMAVALVADRVIFLNKRILADGPPSTILADEQVTKLLGSATGRLGLPIQEGQRWHGDNSAAHGTENA